MSRMQPLDVLASFHTWLHERRVYRGIAECGVAALLLWVGVNALPTASPPLLWTADELPALPAEADNGWTEIGQIPIADPSPEAVTELFDLDPGLDADRFWHQARAERTQLEAWLGAHSEVLAAVELARERPSFVDDCRDLDPCATLHWRRGHDLALGRVVALALAGKRRDSEALLADLLRMDQAQLDSAPTILSVLLAEANARRAMVVAAHLAALDSKGVSRVLRERVASFDARAYDLELLVRVRYQILTQSIHERRAIGRYELGRASFLAFDQGATLAGLNQRLAHAHARAGAGDLAGACGAGQDQLRDHPLARLHNPLGRALLDDLDVSEFCQAIEERAHALEATQVTTLQLLDAHAKARTSRGCTYPVPSTR